MGFFSNLFGKKVCDICGAECGALNRKKLKDDKYICGDCKKKCSKYVRLGEFTLDDVNGHIEYMARMKKLYEEVFSNSALTKKCYPSSFTDMRITFCDDLGMLAIEDRSNRDRYELIRYDQIASYEMYVDESPAQEAGKEPTFNGCGVKIKLVGERDVNGLENERGLRAHPYIKYEIKVEFTKRDKSAVRDAENSIHHFNFIFGVNDDEKGLFSFGMSKAEKRDFMGAVGMAKAMGTIAKSVVSGGGNLTEEQQAQIKENFNAVDDANTGGLAVYSRRADEAEAKIS